MYLYDTECYNSDGKQYRQDSISDGGGEGQGHVSRFSGKKSLGVICSGGEVDCFLFSSPVHR